MLDINLRPDRHELRKFGFVALVMFGLLGGLVYWKKGLFGVDFGGADGKSRDGTLGCWTPFGAFVLVAPDANRLFYIGLTLIAYPIGFIISHVIVAILFFSLSLRQWLCFSVCWEGIHSKGSSIRWRRAIGSHTFSFGIRRAISDNSEQAGLPGACFGGANG